MIKYALQCAEDHGFEAWFRDSAAFDRQAAAGDLACPVCGSTSVRKAIMAPRIGKLDKAGAVARAAEADETTGADSGETKTVALSKPTPEQAALRDKLLELRRAVESTCEHVGPAFAEEARKIHYGETEPRGIYGETSREEAEALEDEGIEVAPLPWVSRGDA